MLQIMPEIPEGFLADRMPEGHSGPPAGPKDGVYPAGMTAYHEILVAPQPTHWLEYVPAAYTGKMPVPLVFCLHGGGSTGWEQFTRTSWHLIADREGLIVVYPTASENLSWQVDRSGAPIDRENNRDIQVILTLLERMKEHYNIDAGRVFIQGMSMGDMMTTQMCRTFPELFTAAGQLAGPSAPGMLYDEKGNPKDYSGPIPVFQSRGSSDTTAIDPSVTRQEINALNRKYWMKINGCDTVPELCLEGDDNLAFYTGVHADFIYRSIAGRTHGENRDEAFYFWYCFFSGLRRDDNGRIVKGIPKDLRRGDAVSVALCDGSPYVLKNGRKYKMDGAAYCKRIEVKFSTPPGGPGGEPGHSQPPKEMPPMRFGPFFYVPVTMLRLFGAEVTTDGVTARIRTHDGRMVTFAEGNINMSLEDRICSLPRHAESKDGILYIPVKWYVRVVMGYCAHELDNVLYINDKDGEMTSDFAAIIRESLG